MQKIIRRRPCEFMPFSAELPNLLQRVYAARGVISEHQLRYTLNDLLKPNFKGMAEAAGLIAEAVIAQAKIVIIGDFDADGATSCALAVLALKAMGLQNVEFLVPNRFEFGYGMSPEIVNVAVAMEPDLIITVDNGIASIEGVEAAKALGIAVVVTDHHLPGNTLPDADAIVNPNQPDCPFESKNLAGVGVIFYVMNAVRSELRNLNWFVESGIKEPNMGQFLDLVALGTVADVVTLDHNNRVLVAQGIARMRAGVARPGIMALLDVAGRAPAKLVASDLGYTVAPRLNAAGRLDDISIGIQCLMSDDFTEAREMAGVLDDFNRDRKTIEQGMQKEALAMLDKVLVNDNAELPWGLCLLDDSWHQGVIGILASRLKEKHHRPVIIFADAGDGNIKGSARSISGLHIRDVLDAVATAHPSLLHKFGGHAMAAGMTLNRENFTAFANAFDQEVRKQLNKESLTAVLMTDGALAVEDVSLPIASLLKNGGPWGQGFPDPVFDGEFFLIQQRIVGERHLKMVLSFDAEGRFPIDAIAFGVDTSFWPNLSIKKVQLVYKLDVNEFRGNQQVQLLVDYLEPCL